MELHPGAKIKVKGLKAAAQFNGTTATITEMDEKSGRWGVKFDETGQVATLKLENMDLIAWNKYDDLLINAQHVRANKKRRDSMSRFIDDKMQITRYDRAREQLLLYKKVYVDNKILLHALRKRVDELMP